jgi:hypothetical protein
MFITPYTSQQPVDDFGLRFSDLSFSASLAATTDTTLTIPGSAPRFKALIKVDGEVWVAVNQTAAVPAGATFASTTSELVNAYYHLCRDVKQGDVLHFYTATASTNVSVVLYSTYTTSS